MLGRDSRGTLDLLVSPQSGTEETCSFWRLRVMGKIKPHAHQAAGQGQKGWMWGLFGVTASLGLGLVCPESGSAWRSRGVSANEFESVCLTHSEATQTERSSLEQRTLYWMEMGGLCPQNLNSPEVFSKASLKARWGKGKWSASAQFSDWLMVPWQGSVTKVTLSIFRLQGAWGLLAHGQIVNIFRLVGIFHICETTQEVGIRYCSLSTSGRS